jgi:putative oxidoreductase
MDESTLTTIWRPRMLAVLRVVTGLLFLEHGSQKLLGFPAGPHPMPELFSLFGFSGVLELVGGALILLGLFTRPVAFLLAGEMAFAYFMGHAPRGFFPVNNGGDAAILYCFVFLYLMVAGAGAVSLDGAMRSGSAERGRLRTA